jgi:menaquinone-dependent protoporphyrinogen oxidase
MIGYGQRLQRIEDDPNPSFFNDQGKKGDSRSRYKTCSNGHFTPFEHAVDEVTAAHCQNSTSMKNLLSVMMVVSLLVTCGMPKIQLVESNYGDAKKISKKILIVYGTRAGSTAEVADFIGKTLAENGAVVDVKPAQNVRSLSGYCAVVIGSAIRAGQLVSEVTDFVETHKSELQRLPTAYFVVCMTLKNNTLENRKTVDAYLDPLRKEVIPVSVGLFAGKLDYSKLGFFAWFIAKYIIKEPEGDFRDWKAIHAWTIEILPKLFASEVPIQ